MSHGAFWVSCPCQMIDEPKGRDDSHVNVKALGGVLHSTEYWKHIAGGTCGELTLSASDPGFG